MVESGPRIVEIVFVTGEQTPYDAFGVWPVVQQIVYAKQSVGVASVNILKEEAQADNCDLKEGVSD